MKNFPFWQKCLMYFNLILVFFSIAIAFAGDSILFALHNSNFDKHSCFDWNWPTACDDEKSVLIVLAALAAKFNV